MSNRRVSKAANVPVQHHEVVSAKGARPKGDFVFCKTHRMVVDLRQCEDCPRCAEVSKIGGVTCWTETLELDRPPAPHAVGRVDLREAAAVASAAEVMSPGQITVTADVDFERLRALFVERGAHALPVVDTEGKLIGVVTERDVVRWQASSVPTEAGAPERSTAGDIMTKVAHALPEGAPLAFAFGLLAACDLHEAPVVRDDGHVVGMITSTDLLRWVARDLGYVLTE